MPWISSPAGPQLGLLCRATQNCEHMVSVLGGQSISLNQLVVCLIPLHQKWSNPSHPTPMLAPLFYFHSVSVCPVSSLQTKGLKTLITRSYQGTVFPFPSIPLNRAAAGLMNTVRITLGASKFRIQSQKPFKTGLTISSMETFDLWIPKFQTINRTDPKYHEL